MSRFEKDLWGFYSWMTLTVCAAAVLLIFPS